MILILKCIFSSLITYQSGKLLAKLIAIKDLCFSEKSFLGIICFAFLSLALNFIFSINQILNTLIFIFLIILFFFNKNFHIKEILITGLLASLILYLANTNNPDGGLYHLPYTQILNEQKLIIGINNLHFRFGLASMLQYVNAIFNNFFLGVEGVTIPVALITSYLIFYLFEEIKKNFYIKRNEQLFLILFYSILLISSLYSFNRYSNYGNDSIVNIFFIIVIIKFVKFYLELDGNLNFINLNNFNIILIYTFFLIANKITFISTGIICLISFLLIKNKKIFSKTFIFLFIFSILWLLKNFFVSGCLIFPISFTCFETFVWTDIELINRERLAGEAWSKGWSLQNEYNNYNDFISKFNWLSVWLKSHFFIVVEKFTPIIIFIIIFILPFLFRGNLNNLSNNKLRKLIYILLFFSFLNIIIWFNFFPIYRYGYSFLLIFFVLLTLFVFLNFIKNPDFNFLKKYIFTAILLSFSLFFVKNVNRIIENKSYNYLTKPFPNIRYSYYIDKNPLIEEKFIDNEFRYYYAPHLCFYNKAPCTNYKIENLKFIKKNGFNIIFLKND